MKAHKLQSGVALIEFALSSIIFFMAFIGVIEFARVTLALNSASQATRAAARIASVCSMDHNVADIQNRVKSLIDASGLIDTKSNPSWLELTYLKSDGTSCTGPDNCVLVQAAIPNLTFKPLMIPGLNVQLTSKVSSVTMRESMNDQIGSDANPSCN